MKGKNNDLGYMTFFEDPWFAISLIKIFPVEEPNIQVDLMERVLSLPQKGHILEVGCGHRPFVELVKRGYQLTGLDLSPTLLEFAKKFLKGTNAEIPLILADMRYMSFDMTFDAVIQWRSFGYFSDDEHKLIFKGVANTLKPDGRYLINLRNRDWMLRHDLGKSWEWIPVNSDDSYPPRILEMFTQDLGRNVQATEDFVLIQEYVFNEREGIQIAKRTVILPNGTRRKSEVLRRFYTLQEIQKILDTAGLRFCEVYGNYDGTSFTVDSPRMIVLSIKKGAS